MRNSEKRSVPDSISILVNYGDDNSHILYNTANEEHNCRVRDANRTREIEGERERERGRERERERKKERELVCI